MSETPRLALPYIVTGQAQKEVTHNEALNRLDALVQPVVVNSTTSVPPGSPASGQAWIVAAGASGAWAGKEGQIAAWFDGWRFFAPAAGWEVWDAAASQKLRFDGTGWAAVPSADPLDLAQTDPAAPAAGTVRLFRRAIAGRQMPAFRGPTGLESPLQSSLALKRVMRANPTGNGTGVATEGMNYVAVGTATSRGVETSNLFRRMRRIGYVSAASAGSLAGVRHQLPNLTTGTGSGLGGFFAVIRFGFSAVVSDMRAFVGAWNVATAPTDVEPSTLTNCIGVGRGAADSTLSLFYGGTAAQTPIPLGANFPANTASVDAYELALFAPPDVAQTVHWQVTRLNTGHVASGTLTGGAAVLPAADVLLTPFQAWVSNNTTAQSVAIDFMSFYAETDY